MSNSNICRWASKCSEQTKATCSFQYLKSSWTNTNEASNSRIYICTSKNERRRTCTTKNEANDSWCLYCQEKRANCTNGYCIPVHWTCTSTCWHQLLSTIEVLRWWRPWSSQRCSRCLSCIWFLLPLIWSRPAPLVISPLFCPSKH